MKKEISSIRHWQVIAFYLCIFDIFSFIGSYFLGLLLRFDFHYSSIPEEYLTAYKSFIFPYALVVLIIFAVFKLYRSVWRYASFNELNRITGAWLVSSILHVVFITASFIRMPISYYLVGSLLHLFFTVGIRFSYRAVSLLRQNLSKEPIKGNNVMIIGAGAAGLILIREIKRSDTRRDNVCCVIDDNKNKWGRYIEGVPIVGGRDNILENIEKHNITQILFAIPSATNAERRDIINICKESHCEIKLLPRVIESVTGDISLRRMKSVSVEDILGRDTIKVNMDEIFSAISGKTILVTGGGGSIGSELCRQIAAHSPKRLIIFDVYENNAYDIQMELKRRYGNKLNMEVLIGSVRDRARMEMIFKTYKPDIVYHAAAHKHVPLMEDSPNEAIKNNVFGTFNSAFAALKYGAQRFVLISTDKAVNPTNVMGASKRICEMVIQTMDAISRTGKIEILEDIRREFQKMSDLDSLSGFDAFAASIKERLNDVTVESIKNKERNSTQFVAVRFGNVLGSNGSVVPLFKKQIEEGGPVTVTHPDINRFFMTIPEAVSLVLQAGIYAWGGEIFVLDMGEPVKIDTLARNLISLSGFEPDVDIKIEYTGLRPGEKLYEEKLMAEEGLMRTDNELIFIGKPIPFEIPLFLEQLSKLYNMAYKNDDSVKEMVKEIVVTYKPEK